MRMNMVPASVRGSSLRVRAGADAGVAACSSDATQQHAGHKRPRAAATSPRAAATSPQSDSGGDAVDALLAAPAPHDEAWLTALVPAWRALEVVAREYAAPCLLRALMWDSADATAPALSVCTCAAGAPVHLLPLPCVLPRPCVPRDAEGCAPAPAPAPPALRSGHDDTPPRAVAWCHLAASAVRHLRVSLHACMAPIGTALLATASVVPVDERPLRALVRRLAAEHLLPQVVAHCAAAAPLPRVQDLLNALHATPEPLGATKLEVYSAALEHGSVRVAQWLFLAAPPYSAGVAHVDRVFAPPPPEWTLRVLIDRAIVAHGATSTDTGSPLWAAPPPRTLCATHGRYADRALAPFPWCGRAAAYCPECAANTLLAVAVSTPALRSLVSELRMGAWRARAGGAEAVAVRLLDAAIRESCSSLEDET